MKTRAFIHGIGFHVPERVMTNAEFESFVETNDEWITTRTGIKERRFVADGEACSDLAAQAARNALADASMQPQDLTHLLLGTLTPDSYVPAGAYIVQEKLGIKGLMAMDFSAACTGFIYGLELSRALSCLHPGAKILLSAAEVLSSRTNFTDRSTCVLFGDGAGAVVITTEEKGAKAEILDVIVSSDGSLGDLLTVKGGGSAHSPKLGQPVDEAYFVQMQGRDVFKHAVRNMESVSREILTKHGLTTTDVDLVIPHQANIRIIEAVGKKLELPEDKVFVNLDKYGNTSAASIGIALSEATASGRIRPGHTVLLTAFGGGFTWGAALLKF